MPYSTNAGQLIKELEKGYTLFVDNDCCFSRKPDDEESGTNYDFSPDDLAYIFGHELSFSLEAV